MLSAGGIVRQRRPLALGGLRLRLGLGLLVVGLTCLAAQGQRLEEDGDGFEGGPPSSPFDVEDGPPTNPLEGVALTVSWDGSAGEGG